MKFALNRRRSRRLVTGVVATGLVAGAGFAAFASQAGASQFVAEKVIMVKTPANVHCVKLDYTDGYNLLPTRSWVGEGAVRSLVPGDWTSTGYGVPTSGDSVSYMTYSVDCKTAQKNTQAHVLVRGFWPNKANGMAHVWIDTTHHHSAHKS
jgi:hypothetical protein